MTAASPGKPGRTLLQAVTLLLVSGLSLLLLLYVGYGEARRTYEGFLLEKLVAQGRLVQNAMDGHLRDGLPLKQYVGFQTLAGPLVEGDRSVASMTVFDQANRPVFVAGAAPVPLLAPAPAGSKQASRYDLRQDGTIFQIVLPLRSKFETVGWLAVVMPKTVLDERLTEAFRPALYAFVGLSIGFAVIGAALGGRSLRGRIQWLHIAYATAFLAMASVVVATLISLYADGAQAKAKALAASLGQRLKDIVEYDLDLKDFDGLDRLFADYRKLNPDISSAGLTLDGVVRAHTAAGAVGQPWKTGAGTYEYIVDLSAAGRAATVRVAVALPAELVWQAVIRSVKNFAALFIASAFIAVLFLQLASSISRVGAAQPTGGPADAAGLDRVRPVFFVAVFFEHLTYAFLPQYVQQAAHELALPAGFASAPFMLYYLCFAGILIPAGQMVQRTGPQRLVSIGLLLSATGMLALTLPIGFYGIALARAAAGIGQGLLFIGIQSYILALASPERRTQAAGIIVVGFQGGMISGMAIGSLLVVYMGAQGVFYLATAIATAIALYAMTLMPRLAPPQAAPAAPRGSPFGGLLRDVREVCRSADFLRTMILIGIPAKAVLTGVVIFALPLLLSRKSFAQEDIGQIIMLYAAGVLLASVQASRFVDRAGRSGAVLVLGSIASGVGLMLIGLVDWIAAARLPLDAEALSTAAILVGVMLVGLAHGLINAPVVTHVADLDIARRIGVNVTTATYRFLERIGHALGPVLVGQLLLLGQQGTAVVAWLGLAITLFGLIFIIRIAAPPAASKGATA